MQDELDQLLSARRGLSQSLCELQARQRELPRAATALAPAVEALQAQLKVIDRQIANLTKAPELTAVKELQKVPGIGPVIAAIRPGGTRCHASPHARFLTPTSSWPTVDWTSGCDKAAKRAGNWA